MNTQAQWISVEERMPEHRQSVALVNVNRWENVGGDEWERNVHACGYWDNWAGGHWSVRGERAMPLEAFTHWMPLPAPPGISPPAASEAAQEAGVAVGVEPEQPKPQGHSVGAQDGATDAALNGLEPGASR